MPSQKALDKGSKMKAGPLKGTIRLRVKNVLGTFYIPNCETAFDAVQRLRIYHFSQLEKAEQA